MGPAQKRDRWASSSSEDEDEKPKTKESKKKKDKEGKGEAAREVSLPGPPAPSQLPLQDDAVASLPLHNPLLAGCRSVYDTYERIERVSEGTYGVVWKARDLATGTLTALKQIKFHAQTDTYCTATNASGPWKEGFPVTALREISVLLALQHESIVSVWEMVAGDAPDKVFMVMEFFECDLKDALRRRRQSPYSAATGGGGGPLAQSELKGILRQVLSGTQHVHDKWYLHRDLKPSNVLVKMSADNNSNTATGGGGRIALADFGLARRYRDPAVSMTLPVATLWYRAPELLFGESRYGPAVDMWSIGCIMGELIRTGGGNLNDDCEEDDGNAILKGQGELDQIDQIFALVGVPNESTWPSFQQLPNAGLLRWKSIPDADILLPKQFLVASSTSSHQTFLDANGYHLLRGLLTLDPAQRLTASQALSHAYFSQGVAPQIPRFFASTASL